MNIKIKTIPHKQQRYDTLGDWEFKENGDLKIKVSNMNNWRYEALVAIHELVEALLCKDFGVSSYIVDSWDATHDDAEEPGEVAGCPYHHQHDVATHIEFILCNELGIKWAEYEKALKEVK